ncbi:MAG: hypothetical protein M3Q27_02655 [Actinomycetota bacterium]|nr:hypothetical protein [Actinomycetota bacterium]
MDVALEPDGGHRVLVETVVEEGHCPSCGVPSSLIKDRPVRRVKNLPHGAVPPQLWVRKRRYRPARNAAVAGCSPRPQRSSRRLRG